MLRAGDLASSPPARDRPHLIAIPAPYPACAPAP